MWKAFDELLTLGWLKSNKLPKHGQLPGGRLRTHCHGLFPGQALCRNIPQRAHRSQRPARAAAVGDFMMLDAIRASGGLALAGREEMIVPWMKRVATLEGVAICPETAVCFDVLAHMVGSRMIADGEEVVVFNTGAAQKYPKPCH